MGYPAGQNMDSEQYAAIKTTSSVAKCQPSSCLEATCRRMHAADDHFGASYVNQSDQWKDIWGIMIGLQQAPTGSRILPGGGLDVII